MSERGRPTRSAISYRPSWPSSPNLTAKSRSRRQPAGSPLSRAATSAAWPWVSNNARGLAMAAGLAQGEQASKMLYYIRRWIGIRPAQGGFRVQHVAFLRRRDRGPCLENLIFEVERLTPAHGGKAGHINQHVPGSGD